MTTTFFEKAFWVMVSLVSVVSLPGLEASTIGERSFDQLRDSIAAGDYPRARRSSPRSNGPRNSDVSAEADYSGEQQLAGYRFGDEFFNHPSAETAEASENAEISRGEAGKKVDGCERVVRDSMICMVCKDPKTHSKYEQCSYVARPQEKFQSYGSSSRTYTGRPATSSRQDEAGHDGHEDETQRKEEATPYGRYRKEDQPEQGSGATLYNSRNENEDSREKPETSSTYSRYTSDDSAEELKTTPSHGRYTEQESSETPEYNKDEDNGAEAGNEGKSYLYGEASSKYGQDEKPSEYEDRLGESSYESTNRRDPNAGGGRPKEIATNSDNRGSRKQGNCREVQKDSMTCTICNDPDNGGNFEKCSYSHQPNDRLYKYSKSKSFGYPGESAAAAAASSAQESKRIVHKTADPRAKKNDGCERLRKNSSTMCNVCQDTVTGAKSEQCEYNLEPKLVKRQISRTVRRFPILSIPSI